MKTEEIQERNKQIALMLRWKLLPKTALHNFREGAWRDKEYKHHFKLEFDSNWNCLMEAVDFIEDLSIIASVQIERQTCYIWKSSEDSNFEDTEITSQTKKEAVFIAVSDFAKLYNEGGFS
jgi:hypothetical protein